MEHDPWFTIALVTSEFGQVWANTKMGTVVLNFVQNRDACRTRNWHKIVSKIVMCAEHENGNCGTQNRNDELIGPGVV